MAGCAWVHYYLEDAWALGFDHVCIATGAGYPRVIHIGIH